jgi:hypothetical protein
MSKRDIEWTLAGEFSPAGDFVVLGWCMDFPGLGPN